MRFTNLSGKITVLISFGIASITLLGYIFWTEGLKQLKVLSTIFLIIVVPMCTILFGGFLDSLQNPWKGIAIVLIITILAVTSIVTCVKLNLIETFYIYE